MLIVAASSLLFYMIAHPTDAFAHGYADVFQGWWDQAKGILAMTQVASSGSRVLVDIRGSNAPVPMAIPITNSQK